MCLVFILILSLNGKLSKLWEIWYIRMYLFHISSSGKWWKSYTYFSHCKTPVSTLAFYNRQSQMCLSVTIFSWFIFRQRTNVINSFFHLLSDMIFCLYKLGEGLCLLLEEDQHLCNGWQSTCRAHFSLSSQSKALIWYLWGKKCPHWNVYTFLLDQIILSKCHSLVSV